jgi:hypothetical protein
VTPSSEDPPNRPPEESTRGESRESGERLDEPALPGNLEFASTGRAVEAVEAVETASAEGGEGGGRLRRYTALGIVAVSILTAAMAWRASAADETAGAKEQLATENVFQQQELMASDESSVIHDIGLFDRYEEHLNLARALQRDAAHASGSAARALAVQVQEARGLARDEQPLFEGPLPTTRPDGSVTFDAAYARSQARLRDFELADLKSPSQLRAQAGVEHERGVRLTGLAVLFVAALVLLTFAELGSPVAARLFAVSGAAVAFTAVVLFVLV